MGGDILLSVDGVAVAGANPRQRLQYARELLAQLQRVRSVGIGYSRDGRSATARVVPGQDSRVMVLAERDGLVGVPASLQGCWTASTACGC